MTRRTERLLARWIWALASLVAVGALGLLAWTYLFSQSPRSLDALVSPDVSANSENTKAIAADVEALSKARMSRKVVPPPPPPTPVAKKPPAPPLESLIRLKGIMDFDGQEALIETIRERVTKSYRVGAAIEGSTARITAINDAVWVKYDGGQYKLTYAGVEKIDPEPEKGQAGGENQ